MSAEPIETCTACGKPKDWRAAMKAREKAARAAAPKVGVSIGTQVEQVIHDLDHIRSRLPTILAVEQELEAIQEMSRNDVMMWMVIDSISVAVIDAVSVCKRAVKPDGALNQLRHHLDLLKDVSAKDVTSVVRPAMPGMTEEALARLAQHHRERTARYRNDWRRKLLPNCAGRPVTEDDVEELIQAFLAQTVPLRADRDKCRAHRFEEKEASIKAAYLLLPQKVWDTVGELVKYFQVVYSVVTNNDFGATVRGLGQNESTAQSIVDVITRGDVNRACKAYGVTPQEATKANPRPFYYQKRHDFTEGRKMVVAFRQAVQDYLGSAPGGGGVILVVVYGSAVRGDYWPGQSDLDVMLVGGDDAIRSALEGLQFPGRPETVEVWQLSPTEFDRLRALRSDAREPFNPIQFGFHGFDTVDNHLAIWPADPENPLEDLEVERSPERLAVLARGRVEHILNDEFERYPNEVAKWACESLKAAQVFFSPPRLPTRHKDECYLRFKEFVPEFEGRSFADKVWQTYHRGEKPSDAEFRTAAHTFIAGLVSLMRPR